MPIDRPDRVVVDTSVGLKWVFEEPGSAEAFALLEGTPLLTSMLFWAEAANVFVTRIRSGTLSVEVSAEAWADLRRVPMRTHALTGEHVDLAFALARRLHHPVYDCCFLALAITEDAVMVTDDRRFLKVLDTAPDLRGHIRPLR